MQKQIYNPIIGKIVSVEFVGEFPKKDGSGSFKKYRVVLNGEDFDALGDKWEGMQGVEKEFEYTENEWTDKLGVKHYGKTLWEKLPPRQAKNSVAEKAQSDYEFEGFVRAKLTRLEKAVEEIHKKLVGK